MGRSVYIESSIKILHITVNGKLAVSIQQILSGKLSNTI